MASALVYTTVGKKMPGILKPIGDKLQEKGIFNTWMLQEQDLIQAFARSFSSSSTRSSSFCSSSYSYLSSPPPWLVQ